MFFSGFCWGFEMRGSSQVLKVQCVLGSISSVLFSFFLLKSFFFSEIVLFSAVSQGYYFKLSIFLFVKCSPTVQQSVS